MQSAVATSVVAVVIVGVRALERSVSALSDVGSSAQGILPVRAAAFCPSFVQCELIPYKERHPPDTCSGVGRCEIVRPGRQTGTAAGVVLRSTGLDRAHGTDKNLYQVYIFCYFYQQSLELIYYGPPYDSSSSSSGRVFGMPVMLESVRPPDKNIRHGCWRYWHVMAGVVIPQAAVGGGGGGGVP